MGISKPNRNNEAFDVSSMEVFGLLLAKFPFILKLSHWLFYFTIFIDVFANWYKHTSFLFLKIYPKVTLPKHKLVSYCNLQKY